MLSIQRFLNPLFLRISFWCSLFFKDISTSRLEPTNGKPCCLSPLTFKISFKPQLTFTRHLTLMNSNLIKQKNYPFFWIKLKHFHTFSVYLYYMYIFHCNNFEHFVCSYSCKLFVIKFFLFTSSGDAYCIWCFTLCSCYMYRILSVIIYAVTK